MEGTAQRFKKLAEEKPFLKRTYFFLQKVVDTRNIKYQKSNLMPKTFLMNRFVVLGSLETESKTALPVGTASSVSDQAPMEISQ